MFSCCWVLVFRGSGAPAALLSGSFCHFTDTQPRSRGASPGFCLARADGANPGLERVLRAREPPRSALVEAVARLREMSVGMVTHQDGGGGGEGWGGGVEEWRGFQSEGQERSRPGSGNGFQNMSCFVKCVLFLH